MQKNILPWITAVFLFIIGLLIGRMQVPSAAPTPTPSSSAMTHVMPDGSVMGNMDMGAMMKDMDAGLRNKTGDAFDRAFLDEMIVHHQGAIDMANQVLAVSQRPELRTMAQAIISAQTAEIRQMETWRSEWFAK